MRLEASRGPRTSSPVTKLAQVPQQRLRSSCTNRVYFHDHHEKLALSSDVPHTICYIPYQNRCPRTPYPGRILVQTLNDHRGCLKGWFD